MRFVLFLILMAQFLFSSPLLFPASHVKAYNPMLPPPPIARVSDINAMPLGDFVRMSSKVLKKTIIFTGTLKGTVDYISSNDLSKLEVMPLLKVALSINNYTLVDKGSYFTVIETKDQKRFGHDLHTKVIVFKYVSPVTVMEGFKTLLTPQGSLFATDKALIVTDTKEVINRVFDISKQLDIKTTQSSDLIFHTFLVKNLSVNSVLETLRISFKESNTTDNKASLFSSNHDSNSIFFLGSKEDFNRTKSIISSIDQEQKQVYLSIKIVEINNDKSRTLGFQYGLAGGIVSPSNFLTFSGNFGGSSIVSIPQTTLTRLMPSFGTGTAITKLINIGASLDFLQNNGVSRTVSEPSVLCLNGRESRVIVGKSLSFLTGSTTGSAGTSNSLTRNDIGLNLTVKPFIIDDKVNLSFDATLESLLPQLDSNNQPLTTKEQLTTTSIVRTGETIVLGGFIKSYKADIDEGIPFLDSIPYLGALFQHKTQQEQKDTVMIFVTPYIVNSSSTLSQLQEDLGILGNYIKTIK